MIEHILCWVMEKAIADASTYKEKLLTLELAIKMLENFDSFFQNQQNALSRLKDIPARFSKILQYKEKIYKVKQALLINNTKLY